MSIFGKIMGAIFGTKAEAAPAADESRLTSVVKKVLGLGSDAKLKVRGFDDLLVYRAKCCNPIRGEEIIGALQVDVDRLKRGTRRSPRSGYGAPFVLPTQAPEVLCGLPMHRPLIESAIRSAAYGEWRTPRS